MWLVARLNMYFVVSRFYCVCVRACVRACVSACVCVCVYVCVGGVSVQKSHLPLVYTLLTFFHMNLA